jgi:NADH-quinone oxidoreductase subunit N
MIHQLYPIGLEISLFFAAMGSILMGAFNVRKNLIISISFSTVIAGLFCNYFFTKHGLFFEKLWMNTPLSSLMKIGSFSVFITALAMSFKFVEGFSLKIDEYLGLTFFAMLGASIMMSAQHGMVLYLGLEIQSLSLYTLISMYRGSFFSSEAGIKYFILGSFASVIFLLGCSYIYAGAHSLHFHEILDFCKVKEVSGPILIGMLLVLSAFFFKLGLVPFHQWMPDAYQGSALPVTLVLATLSKITALTVLIRLLLEPFYFLWAQWSIELVLSSVIIISLLVGALVPLVQNSFKRLLGYSSIGHMGFLLIGLLGGEDYGIASSLLYIFVYMLANILIFVALMYSHDQAKTVNEDILIDDLAGLHAKAPATALVISIAMLTMSGLPPLIGFFPKMIILQYALTKEYMCISGVAMLCAVISVYYYLRVIKIMYMDPVSKFVETMKDGGRLPFLIWVFLSFQFIGCYWPFLQLFFKKVILLSLAV